MSQTKMNDSVAELIELSRNPNVEKIFRSDFYKKERSEQERIIKQVPQFAEEGIDIETVIDTSRNYYFSSVDFLGNELREHMNNRVISKQDKDGGWPLVDRDYLIKMRSKDPIDDIDEYLKNYKDTFNEVYDTNVQDYKEVLVPTYWTNYLVLLLLNKWKTCLEKHQNIPVSYPLEKIVNAIDNGKSWLKANSLDRGWSFSHKTISNTLNTYDTCMALIAINYDLSYQSINGNGDFFGKNHLEGLIDPAIRNENGSWKKELGQESEDTGATAYATQTLLKYYLRGSDEQFKDTIKPIIKKGIEWLINNQRQADNGWGDLSRDKSKFSFLEKTSYALMALSKYQKIFLDYSVTDVIDRGISFLKKKKRIYKDYPLGLIWPNDYETDKNPEEWEDSLKISSLVISAMLRCGVKNHNLVIQKGIIGTSRLYENTYEHQKRYWYNPIYYFCMIADFLRRT